MAKQHEETPEILNTSTPSPAQQITMSANEFKSMVETLMAQSATVNAESNKAFAETLAAALRDSNKPYVKPGTEENEEMFRKITREQEERKRKQMLASQEWCQHIAGGLGDVRDPGNRTSIVWHRFDHGATIGVCTQCNRVFRESDTDFRKWWGMPKFNKMSRSGDRYIEKTAAAV